jgi:hypothetical protein
MKQVFLTLGIIEIICSIFMTSCADMKGLSLKEGIHFDKHGFSEKLEIEEKF